MHQECITDFEREKLHSTRKRTDRPAEIRLIKVCLMRLSDKKNPGKSSQNIFQQELDENSFPISPAPNIKTHDVAYMVINKDELCTAYTDLTGRLSYQSSRGNKYLLINYRYDSNFIVGHALKNRKKKLLRLHGRTCTIGLTALVLLLTLMLWITKFHRNLLKH